jgi:hypothetical protein
MKRHKVKKRRIYMLKKDDPGQKKNEHNADQNEQSGQNKSPNGYGKLQNQSQNTAQAHNNKQLRPYRKNNYNRSHAQNFGQKRQPHKAEPSLSREGAKNTRRKDLQTKTSFTGNTPYGRHDASRSKIEETVENIQEDILRIEKEIELEIKVIRGLKL